MSLLGTLAPALFVLLWSSAFVGAKYGLPDAEPLTFLCLRFALVAAAFAAIAVAMRAPWPKNRRLFGHVALVGALVHGIYLSGVFIAIDRGLPAGMAALIVGLHPVLTALLAGRFLGERVSARQWTGLALGFAGVALVVAERTGLGQLDPTGIAACFVALIAIGLGTVHQKRYATGMNLVTGSAVQNATAFALTGMGALVFESLRIDWTPAFVLALGWLTIVVSLGAFSLLMAMIRAGEATRVVGLFYLVPPTTAVLAWIAFGERIALLGILGIAVAAIGVALVIRPARA